MFRGLQNLSVITLEVTRPEKEVNFPNHWFGHSFSEQFGFSQNLLSAFGGLSRSLAVMLSNTKFGNIR